LDALKKALAEMKEKKPALSVLVYQGDRQGAKKCAEKCNELRAADNKYAAIRAMLCLEEEETPPGQPEMVGTTMVIGVGHKGRYVGVVGAFKKKDSDDFELKYQLVSIGPQYETPRGKEKDNPVMALMEEYAQNVKLGNYLSQFPRTTHPLQNEVKSEYVGSARCGKCHEEAYKIWKTSAHSHAFQTLVDAKNPILRQFDGECVACHTVGFKYLSGYGDPANDAKRNQMLVDVGCESCHGPGGAHVKDKLNPKLHVLMNPFKAKEGETVLARQRRINSLDTFCQKCHDVDNDVNWGKVPFQVKWRMIAHPTPRGDATPAAKN
jgi:cytochrome c554/c'-like protein